MSTTKRSPKGEITLYDVTKHRGNSDQDIEVKLSVKDDDSLIMEKYNEYFDAYKCKTTKTKVLYEIEIKDVIDFIKNKGTKVDDQI